MQLRKYEYVFDRPNDAGEYRSTSYFHTNAANSKPVFGLKNLHRTHVRLTIRLTGTGNLRMWRKSTYLTYYGSELPDHSRGL